MCDVICLGELLVEFVANSDNKALADVPGFIKAPGGAPANVAVALQRLGLDTAFIGKVGADPFGEYLRDSLAEFRVNTKHLLTDTNARTTAVFVAVWDDGHKDVCFYRNPGADMLLHESEIDSQLFATARCFHFGSISLIDEPSASAQRKALALAKKQGLMISYDPNFRAPLWPDHKQAAEVIRTTYRDCHLAKISEEELTIATGQQDIEKAAQAVLDEGVELVVISRGGKGAVASNGSYWIEQASPAVTVVETTGAGDAFVAAMIFKLLTQREQTGSLRSIDQSIVEQALRFATAAGALSCCQRGAIPALPDLAAIEQLLNNI